jgi:putative Mg2+ transporter-C (MgtC) family protein
VRLTTSADHLDDGRELLREELKRANYPLQDMEVIEREQGGTELVATLLGSTADPQELNAIVMRLDDNPLVENASWNLRTSE